jgi:membrane protein
VPLILLLLAGLGHLLQGANGVDATALFGNFLPPHQTGPGDPFATAEALLGRLARFGQEVTLVAVPAFLWFATRAFASVRTALSDIYDTGLRPSHRHFLIGFVLGKARDLTMVGMTIVLFLASTAISTGLALGQAWGRERIPELAFWVGTVGRMVAQGVAFGFIVLFFLLLYRFGSVRRMRLPAVVVASLFAALAFELARRLYAFYITNIAAWNVATWDAGLGAIVLFVIWVYYSSLVFLLGGVVAETWELRRLQHRQRAILA